MAAALALALDHAIVLDPSHGTPGLNSKLLIASRGHRKGPPVQNSKLLIGYSASHGQVGGCVMWEGVGVSNQTGGEGVCVCVCVCVCTVYSVQCMYVGKHLCKCTVQCIYMNAKVCACDIITSHTQKNFHVYSVG